MMGRKKRDKKVKQPQKKKQASWLTYIAYAFILFGLGALLYPIVANFLAERQRSEATSVYQDESKKMTQLEKDNSKELAKQYNRDIFEQQKGNGSQMTTKYQDILKSNSGVMGTLEIPALNIKSLPFFHGTSYGVLDKGLGHFKPTSIPIGGENTRSVITGHSGMQNQVLFSDINRLKEGDIFFIHILGETLAYEIRSFEEVLPDDSNKVSIIPGEDIVTLLTCTPPGINTYRLLVNGYRIPYEKGMSHPVERRNLWSYQRIVGISLLITVILFVILGLRYRQLRKGLKSSDKEKVKKAEKQISYLITSIRGLFLLVIMTMLTVLALAFYGYQEAQKNIMIPDIKVGTSTKLGDFNKDKTLHADYDTTQIKSVGIQNYTEALASYQENVNQWGIGKLVIPGVSIDLPVLAGLSNSNLLTGAATFQENQQMGQGNYVLMSHNLVGANALLNNMDQLKNGDVMYLTDFNQVYQYKVTRNEVIEETEISVLDETTNKELTLIRCEGDIGTIYRRVVQGELITSNFVEEMESSQLQMLGLTKEENKKGEIIQEAALTRLQEFCMKLAAAIIANPVQTVIPLFLLLMFPIIMLGILR